MSVHSSFSLLDNRHDAFCTRADFAWDVPRSWACALRGESDAQKPLAAVRAVILASLFAHIRHKISARYLSDIARHLKQAD